MHVYEKIVSMTFHVFTTYNLPAATGFELLFHALKRIDKATTL